MSFPKIWLFPFIKDGQTVKQQIIRYLLFIAYFSAILSFVCYMAVRIKGPSAIYSCDSKEEQFRKVKKLKPLAYKAAKRQYRINSKISSTIEFAPY